MLLWLSMGVYIEVFQGEVPFKEIDDLEMAIRLCPLVLFDISTPFSKLSAEQWTILLGP